MSTGDLLYEVGTEEIPAGFLGKVLGELGDLVEARLRDVRLPHGRITVQGTPRRLAVHVAELADRQVDIAETVTGPPASAAFDKEGKPTKAALGFAAKSGVPVEALTVVEVPGKGAYVAARREQRGVETRALLPRLLADLTRTIPWKKSMRWASLDDTFVRPVHWIVALYAGEPIPLELFGVRSGRETRGHRFLAPTTIPLEGSLDDYRGKLRAAFVLVDPASRATEIEAELLRIQRTHGVRVRADEELLAEVTNLVEYPQAICGEFDARYLVLPPEVIISAMRAHQRYFATEAESGELTNRFVTIAGTLTRDPAVVRHGNERVLAARLADASFFHEEDRATPLDEVARKLDGVVFQAKLGTIGDKVARLAAWAPRLAELGVDPGRYGRAVRLAKADLVTKMVGEFPDLQGVMGRHYALLAGEDPEVADAILEHYLPRGASDRLPRGALGAALGIADRIDTIVGCWAVGLAPTGSADAFGLRRASLAVLNLLIARGWRSSLRSLVDEALGHLAGKLAPRPDLAGQVLEFFRGRLRGLLVEGRGLAADCVDAALAVGFDDVPDALDRATAVAHLRDRPDFEPLGIAFKRVANILKGEEIAAGVEAELLREPSERALWERFQATRDAVDGHLAGRAYDAALRELATLKPAVDAFFDDVLVMDPDPGLRRNRLALLGTINGTFTRIADFRQLAVK